MENLEEALLGKSTVKRRKATAFIRKNFLIEYSDILLEALRIEEGKSHRDTEEEIVETLGFIGNEDSKVKIKEDYIDKGFFLLTSTKSYIRLNRESLEDVKDVIESLESGDYSKMEGALEVLGYDKMVPSLENQEKIISLCLDFGKDRERGYTDPRYGLAAACAGWTSESVKPFLENSLLSNDTPLAYVAEKSLKKKYVKLR